MKSKLLKLFALAMVAGVTANEASGATIVGLELALLVDVSGSVDNAEYLAQRNGYVAAFNNPLVHSAISTLAAQNGGNGLAVSYIEFAAAGNQSPQVGWTLLNNAADSIAFAAAIAGTTRAFNSGTGVADAITYGTNSILTNAFDGVRLVIDVSGDGRDNQAVNDATSTANTLAARNAALGAGVDRINGLPILGESGLLAWYQTNVQGGPNSFTLAVNSFDDFEPAVLAKINAEIRNESVPEGGPGLAMSGLLLLGLGWIHRIKSRR